MLFTPDACTKYIFPVSIVFTHVLRPKNNFFHQTIDVNDSIESSDRTLFNLINFRKATAETWCLGVSCHKCRLFLDIIDVQHLKQ